MTGRTFWSGVGWLVMSAGLLLATVFTLGLPDLGLAGGLLSGAYPTLASAVALASLICYLALLTVLVLSVTQVVRTGLAGLLAIRPALALAFLIAGAVLLSLSVAGRLDGGGNLCCGASPQLVHEATSLVRQ
jgi:hypothetical protein